MGGEKGGGEGEGDSGSDGDEGVSPTTAEVGGGGDGGNDGLTGKTLTAGSLTAGGVLGAAGGGVLAAAMCVKNCNARCCCDPDSDMSGCTSGVLRGCM